MAFSDWLYGVIFGLMALPCAIGVVWLISVIKKLGYWPKKEEKKQESKEMKE